MSRVICNFIICSFSFTVEVEDVFKLGSVKPGAMLYDANVEYEVFVFLIYLLLSIFQT